MRFCESSFFRHRAPADTYVGYIALLMWHALAIWALLRCHLKILLELLG